ncbi:MAG: putative inorganic carbon transporter subunit DabA, partial [Bacteroidota bacterium]
MYTEQTRITPAAIKDILHDGVKKIAPLWSLENFVAVNPYLGLAGKQFSEAMSFLSKTGKTKATLPADFYLQAMKEGHMDHSDLAYTLQHNKLGVNYDVEEFLVRLPIELEQSSDDTVKTLADAAGATRGKQWSRFMVDRISFWASAYFDEEQAGWDTAKEQTSLFKAWKQEAEIDRSTEVMGLKGFRKIVKKLPSDYYSASIWALEILDIAPESLPHYINALSMKINGWLGLTGRIDWDANLNGIESHYAEELLAIALVWEMCIHECLQTKELEQLWQKTKVRNQQLATSGEIDRSLAFHLILQEAFDHANQRMILDKINNQETTLPRHTESKVQAIFCIDVRSELFRRNLEAADENIETMGFAGFFGFPIEYVPLGHEHGTSQCPALLTTSHTVEESLGDLNMEQITIEDRKLRRQVAKAWSSFKTGAISCFSFVSPVGLSYLPKLFTDSFGFTRPVPRPQDANLPASVRSKKKVRLHTSRGTDRLRGIPAEDRLEMATSALKALSLTDNFARIVLVMGHEATTVNNPHASGLDCGACGGKSGESNAKVAAAVLNDPEVREGLKGNGIDIPSTTIFLAGLHDTTTDQVALFHTDELPSSHQEDMVALRYALDIAGESARKERAVRMNITTGDLSKQVIQRSNDWSQVRPE